MLYIYGNPMILNSYQFRVLKLKKSLLWLLFGAPIRAPQITLKRDFF